MLILCSFLVFIAQEEPLDILHKLKARYGALSAFSMNIEHRNSSGLFPGEYEQRLLWKKGHFELTVVIPAEGEFNKAPNYFCNGTSVQYGENGHRYPIEIENVLPGWEVSGGLILSWLMKTRSDAYFFNPPPEIEIKMSFGARKTWQGEPVREILVLQKRKATQETIQLTLFVSPNFERLVGCEWKREGRTGWMHYKQQMFHPVLPDVLGEPPSVRERIASLLQELKTAEGKREVEILHRIGAFGSEAVPALINLLRDPKHEAEALLQLTSIKDERTLAALIIHLKNAKTEGERITRLYAIGNHGNPRVFRIILPYLNSKDKYVRYAAIYSLGSIGHPDAISHLSKLTKDKDPSVRFLAKEGIAKTRQIMRKYPDRLKRYGIQ